MSSSADNIKYSVKYINVKYNIKYTVKDAMPASFRSELFTSYILTKLKQ